ncbi:MAG: hypothetical protein GYA24_09510, partial [Candidatus Lokiarchaeota archaeon]|nr:hypothetical protein [Candidatus Lokiarchaeota archaeon]
MTIIKDVFLEGSSWHHGHRSSAASGYHQSYQLDFYVPGSSAVRFLSYQLPSGKSDIDVGAIHHPSKKFFLIECKAKHNIDHDGYDGVKLRAGINADFEHFRDETISA